MITRTLEPILLDTVRQYPVLTLTGPRQSGKTTLLKSLFKKKKYVSLEDPEQRALALHDPRAFLEPVEHGMVIDEAQRAPEIFSYIQGIVDDQKKSGMYILSGSQHFLLLESISQSLAGRSAIFHLFPFSYEELSRADKPAVNTAEIILRGFYPRIHDLSLKPRQWYADYINTYIERDVRTIKNIDNLNSFQKFVKLCAGRNGQILNLSGLANDCGVTYHTVKSWLSILEASFIIFLLPPFYENFNKRMIKSPKLYFYDCGLLCYLLGIYDKQTLDLHPFRGQIFEALVLSEMKKYFYHRGMRPDLYYWRDQTGHEIDCLLDQGYNRLTAFEIKSAHTINAGFFHDLAYFRSLARPARSVLVYNGQRDAERDGVSILPWTSLEKLF